MNASCEWLRDFTPFDLAPAQLRDLLTARAATVEDVIALRADLGDVVVGVVAEAKPHPDSDHLWVTKVDAGTGELLDVVCGAPNVKAGSKYPFAPAGSTLPGGLKLERRKIRGAISNGMLCSARELGLGTDHQGILALDTDAAPGTRFLDVYPAGDTRLVVDVLPNRPDLLSHEGIAREIAAFTGRALSRPRHGDEASVARATHHRTSGVTDGITVTVEAADACPLYVATVIRGVRVAPSPAWLVERLQAVGSRSINNVVDATNYMLHGFGQPMHAFDLARLEGGEVRVRRAHGGERIVTLDGTERSLTDRMTVIADARRAQAIAGIIGGRESEVTDSTTDLLLEVAIFDPRDVRRTRKALGVSTDASYRYERAMNAAGAEDLARYAAALIIDVAGGRIDAAPLAVGVQPEPAPPVELRVARVATLLGEAVPAPECTALLETVGFGVTHSGDGILTVAVPAWRSDVAIEADLIEEIARLRGYDSFSSELRPFRVGTAVDSASYTVTRRVTRALVGQGLLEARPLPFVADAGEAGVCVRNPLAASESMLRASALQTLAARVEHNFAHMVRNVRLFDVGVVFSRSESELPRERTVAAAVICGDRTPAHFTNPRPAQVDLWDAKWLAEVIARSAFGDEGWSLRPDDARGGWRVVRDGAAIGFAGPVHVDAPVWASPVFGVEIDITDAFGLVAAPPRYRALAVTPAAEFDLALVVPESVSADDVRRTIAAASGELLESLIPFDEFRGGDLGAGERSVAWRLTFRHPERTLRDKEIEGRRARVLRALDEELGVRPRAS